jgi:hypothetical protein
VVLSAAVLFGCAGLAPVSPGDADRKLSDAIERELPSLVSAGDYWTASKVSFQLAGARSRLNETRAACTALSNSLDYYGRALARNTDTPLYEFGTGPGDDEGMMEIRSMFGCVGERSAKPLREHAPHPQARKTLISPIQQG